jgi:hypothetical protein
LLQKAQAPEYVLVGSGLFPSHDRKKNAQQHFAKNMTWCDGIGALSTIECLMVCVALEVPAASLNRRIDYKYKMDKITFND